MLEIHFFSLILLYLLIHDLFLLLLLLLPCFKQFGLNFFDVLFLFNGSCHDDLPLLVQLEELNFQFAHRLNLIFLVNLYVRLLHNNVDLLRKLINGLLAGPNVSQVPNQS